MSIIYALAKALAKEEQFNGVWPEPAEQVTQTSTYTLTFDEPVYSYVHWRTKETTLTEEFEDVSGMPYLNEYNEGETVTREQYEEFVKQVVGGDHSKLSAYFDNISRINTAKIAELNKQVGELVNQIADLAAEAGLPAEVDLGNRGSLDLDGPWDSSSAYC